MKNTIRDTAILVLLACGTAHSQSPALDPLPDPAQFVDIKTPAPPRPIHTPAADDADAIRPPAPLSEHTRAQVGQGVLVGLDRQKVYFDEPGDGTTWAAGDTYKASFGPEGATYVPFFGSRAPQNYPVAFRLAALRAGGTAIAFDAEVAPVREGNRIAFDRGSVVEVYDLTPSSIEQSFVFHTALAGRIEVEIAVDSELARSRDGSALVLASGIGSVRYGTAFALDSRVGRTELASAWEGDAIRLVVPAERVAAASWPLVIDPLITNFDVDLQTDVDTLPDIAYDFSTGLWMSVQERIFSATDHDVYYHMGDTGGPSTEMGWIDISTNYWAGPKIANLNFGNRFLCVAAAGSPTGGSRDIKGRIRMADSGGALEAVLTISNSGDISDQYFPDVGGSPTTGAGSPFCVVWQRDFAANDHDILARLINVSGSPHTGVIFLSNSGGTLDNQPSVSKSCGRPNTSAEQIWNVVWARFQGNFDNDIMGAQIAAPAGTVVSQPFYIDSSSVNDYAATVSSPTADVSRTYLVAATRQALVFGDTNTHGWVLRGSTLVDSANLTALSGAPTAQSQYNPSADCDGTLFVVADEESLTPSNFNVCISTFHMIGNQLTLGEGHKLMASSSTSEAEIEVACAASSGGDARLTVAVWHDYTSSGNGDIEAGYYGASPFAQFCDPGSDGVMACPCLNPPTSADRGCNNSANTGGARIVAVGGVEPDTVQLQAIDMQPSAICLFVQGSAFSSLGTPFGDGIRCVSGTFLRLGTKTASGGAAQYPVGVDPTITQRAAALGAPIVEGTDRYYFAYYRDPGLTGCAATFNTTNAVRIRW